MERVLVPVFVGVGCWVLALLFVIAEFFVVLFFWVLALLLVVLALFLSVSVVGVGVVLVLRRRRRFGTGFGDCRRCCWWGRRYWHCCVGGGGGVGVVLRRPQRCLDRFLVFVGVDVDAVVVVVLFRAVRWVLFGVVGDCCV